MGIFSHVIRIGNSIIRSDENAVNDVTAVYEREFKIDEDEHFKVLGFLYKSGALGWMISSGDYEAVHVIRKSDCSWVMPDRNGQPTEILEEYRNVCEQAYSEYVLRLTLA